MATTIVFRNLTTHPRAIPQNGYKDMLVANPVATSTDLATDAVTPIERPILLAGVPMRFWSERVATEVTIAGSVTFTLRSGVMGAGFTGRFRAYLSKITVGGSNVESPIGQADATADLVAGTGYTFSFTPVVPVTVAPNERFICRVTVMPIAGSFGTGTVALKYNGGTDISTSSVTFTETVTFRQNGVLLFLQPTTSGIGNFFDMTETRAGVSTTGVVNTTAGGTEIPWTRTAGGTALEWISARFKAPGWTVDSMAVFGDTSAQPPVPGTAPTIWGLESNAAANATVRLKVFRRKPDGTELLVATWTYTVIEFPGTQFEHILTPGSTTRVFAQVTSFAEDDRLVARVYCVPFTGLTMGGGFTCTVGYNGQSPGLARDSFVSILDSPEFKASGDPDRVEGPVPDGLPMLGVGN